MIVQVEKNVKDRTSELVKLRFSARHYNLSVVVITQQLTSIAKPFRENISKLVTFYNPNKKDITTIIQEYLDVNDRKQKNIHAWKLVLFPFGYTVRH